MFGWHLTATLTRLLVPVWERIDHIEKRIRIMSENQTHIDTDVAALQSGLAGIVDEIAALKAQPGSDVLDFTALDAVTAAVTAVTAPVEPTV